jgi:septum site-determining protein MinC
VNSSVEHSIRFHARSFLAFTLTPEPPVFDWLAKLDKWMRVFPGFFVRKGIVLDLAVVKLSESAIAHLIAQLAERGIRVMGLEGVDPAALGSQLPPVLHGPCSGGEDKAPNDPTEAGPREASPLHQRLPSLLLDSPVRSGQSVMFPFGDVTVLGSVASGAEVAAGGSIHIYGALRGRCMAGSMGNARARIFCTRNEAELIAIDGHYRTAEGMDAGLRGRSVQVWLEGADLAIATLE